VHSTFLGRLLATWCDAGNAKETTAVTERKPITRIVASHPIFQTNTQLE